MKTTAPHRMGREMISAAVIRRRIDRMARDIAQFYGPDDPLTIIAILNGSYVFLADLARRLFQQGLFPRIDFMALASYGRRTKSPGQVTWKLKTSLPAKNRRILLIDDILDSGLTLSCAREWLMTAGAKDVTLCVLLDKPSRRQVAIRADFTGFVIPDCFVAGYGLDYDHHYRHLPSIVEIVFTSPVSPSKGKPSGS